MSKLHLTTGSVEPPRIEGQLRIFSMEFCPYAHRARLVLRAKNLAHDVVNINLINKPEWYFKIHAEGKVPALLTPSGDVIVESIDISNWLDEKYPETPLYPADPAAKQADKDLIKQLDALTSVFARCLFGEEKTPAEWVDEFTPVVQGFETELAKRPGPFFGGSQPGMVDYMMWPWGERTGTVAIKLGAALPFAEGQFPCMRKWKKAMRAHPVVDALYTGSEKFWKCAQMKLKKMKPDYDSI